MAYREKLAALNLVAMALVYTAYFTLVATHPPEPRLLEMLWLFGIAVPIHAMLYGFIGYAIKLRAGREGSAPADERDRAIARRGRSIAYLVLAAGVILVSVMPGSEALRKFINAPLLALVIAELVNQTMVLLSYRRGWHG
jgi:hypothetical protein